VRRERRNLRRYRYARRKRRVFAATGHVELLEAVARETGVPVETILARTRGTADAAFARQLLMYLLNVGLGRSFDEIALLLDRDRKTVTHACAVIEDLRDTPGLEEAIVSLEIALAAQRDSMEGAHALQ
jgi:chromosomal replication initiation ATPase DnaA